MKIFLIRHGESMQNTKENKMGIRGSATYELIFEDCRIPKENCDRCRKDGGATFASGG